MKLEEMEQDLKKFFNINWKKQLVGASVSFGFGAGLGAIGKHTGHNEIPAVPIAMDLMFGRPSFTGFLCYGAGIAMNYLPEIYQVYQNMQNFGG